MPDRWGNTGEISMLTSMPYQSPYRGRYEGIGQLPFIGDNPFMQMGGQFLGRMGVQAAGLLPLGRGRENMYGRMSDYGLTQLHDEMMRDLATEERSTWMRGMRGAAEMLGVPWEEPQRRAAGHVADVVNTFAPMFASYSPELLDVLGGRRGSALALGEYAFRGGRHRMDPTTGRLGMSGESIEQLVSGIRTTMYDSDEEGAAQTRDVGFSMGEQGQLFADLQRRGMVAGPARNLAAMMGRDEFPGRPRYSRETEGEWQQGVLEQRTNITKAIERQYEAEDMEVPRDDAGRIDLQAIQRDRPMLDRVMQDPGMQEVAQELDSRRIISTLENYGGAVKAMREIFGDAGNPNAPMPELINAINALTGNAMAQTDPGRVEMMVRETYALAEATGVGLPGMMMMTQVANDQAAALGLNPAFANESVRGALAFRQAAQGRGLAGYPAWARGDIEDFTQMEQSLQLSAASSTAANRMGAAMRIRASMAAPGEDTPFDADSPVEQWLRALQAGQRAVNIDFGGGRTELMTAELDNDQFLDIMQSSAAQADVPLSGATIMEMLGQRQQNQRLIFEQGLTPIVRNLQPNDAVLRASVAAQWAASTRVQGLGLDLDRAASRRLVGGLAATVAQAIPGLDPEIATDPGRLRRHLARQMLTGLQAAEADEDNPLQAEAAAVLTRFEGDEAGLNQWLAGTAESMQATIDERLRDTVYGGIQGMAVMQNRENLGDAARNTFLARTEGRISAAMAPLGAGGPVRRAVEAVMAGPEGGGADIMSVLGTMVGGDRVEGMREELAPILEGLQTSRKELDDAVEAWRNSDDEHRAELAKEVEEKTKELEQATEGFSAYIERQGLRLDAPVGHDELRRAWAHQKWTRDRLDELAGGEADLAKLNVDRPTRTQVEEAAGDLGVSVGKLMSMERDEFDTLLKDSDAISKEQAAVVRRTRNEVDTQMEEALNTEKEEAAEHAHRLLDDTRAMRAGGDELLGGVQQTLAAYEELQVLTGEAGSARAAATGEATRERYAAAQGRLREGTAVMRAEGFRAGYGFLGEAQQERFTGIVKRLSTAGLVEGAADVMALSETELRKFRGPNGQGLSEEEITFTMGVQQEQKDYDARVREANKDHAASATMTMAESLSKLTGREVTDRTVAEELERFGAESWMTAIQGSGPGAALARDRFKARATTVAAIRGVRGTVGMEGESLEDVLFTEEGEARSEEWYKDRGVFDIEMAAIREAQGWEGDKQTWLRMEDGVEGEPAAAKQTPLDKLLPESARTPQTAADGRGGTTSVNLRIERLVMNGRDTGPATATGDGEPIDDEMDASDTV